jgi:hypothetical protein
MTASESAALGAVSYLRNVSPASYVRELIRKNVKRLLPTLYKKEIKAIA